MRSNLTFPSLLVFTTSLLAACSGGGGTPAPAPESGTFSLLLTTSTVTVASGSSTSVNVTVVPTGGFNKSVTFGTASKPSDLGASFSPPNSPTTTTLTLDASTLAAGTYDFFVKGSATVNGAAVSDTKALQLVVTSPPGMTLSGQVRNAFGVPLADATVTFRRPATPLRTATTDANGHFSFSDVRAPYSLTIAPNGTSTTHSFEGLTRPDPTLVLFGVAGGAPLQAKATVSGTLSGAIFPVPASHVVGIAFANTSDGKGAVGLGAGSAANYGFEASWSGGSTTAGTLHALYGKVSPASPTLFDSFSGYATRGVNLSNGLTAGGQNMTFQALGAAQNSAISAVVAAPAATTVTNKRVFLSLGPKSFLLIGVDATPNLTNTYRTPVIPGKTLGIVVDAKQGERSVTLQKTGLQPNEVVNVSLPNPVALAAPANGATNVAKNTTLSWSAVPNSVYLLLLPNKVVYTSGTSYAAALGANTTYTWTAVSAGPFASLDDFAGTTWAAGYPVPGDDATYTVTSAETRSFKTAP